ncbi:MAG: hypothetical protein V4539_01050 [Bacteroidota bacterium]
MNNKVLILFPMDATTDFLEEVTSYLSANVNSSQFSLVRIEANDEAHEKALKKAAEAGNELVLFLGHGSFSALYGSEKDGYNNEDFITLRKFQVFRKKRVILVSCESRKLLKKAKAAGYSEAVGFGDLPTDPRDIGSARELDVNAYKGLSDELVEKFKNALVEIIKYSLTDFINNALSLSQFCDLIILRTNKRIARYYTSDRVANAPLSNALLRMKEEVLFIKNNS